MSSLQGPFIAWLAPLTAALLGACLACQPGPVSKTNSSPNHTLEARLKTLLDAANEARRRFASLDETGDEEQRRAAIREARERFSRLLIEVEALEASGESTPVTEEYRLEAALNLHELVELARPGDFRGPAEVEDR